MAQIDSHITMQKLSELERMMAYKEEQVETYARQLALTAATLQSTVVAVLQQSSDLLSFFTARGYATPDAVTAVLNKMAASGGGMRALTSFRGVEVQLASPEVSRADERVLDWVAATSSQGGLSSGAHTSSTLACSDVH